MATRRTCYPLGGNPIAWNQSPPGAWTKRPSRAKSILRKLRERIVGFAASRMQRDAAEDLAQEVLILLHEKYGHLDRLEDLLPLSLKIVRFKMLAYP